MIKDKSMKKKIIEDAYVNLRTNLQFSSLSKNIKSIVITSANYKEGKTYVALNLAEVLANNKRKTLLIDCSLEKPEIHRRINAYVNRGLTNIIVEDLNFDDVVNKDVIENLDVLTSGMKTRNSSDILNSDVTRKLMKELRVKYEYIIIDTPPVLHSPDAQIMVQFTDGCLLVVSEEEASYNTIIKAKESLIKVNANIIGGVINNAPRNNTHNKLPKNNRKKRGKHFKK